MGVLEFLDKHKGLAAMLGAFGSMTVGATWWLAKGGAAAFIMSVQALSDPEIAKTLQGLPEYQESKQATLAEMQSTLQQVSDAVESLRLASEVVVEWAPEHSQRLTDAVGGCYPGDDCEVFLRGRRTQAGAACALRLSKPRMVLSDGREFPVTFTKGHKLLDLTTEFSTIPVEFTVPEFIPAGIAGVVIVNVYSDCPFAPEGVEVERETFTLVVEVKPRD